MSIDWFTPLYLLAIYGVVRFFRRSKSDTEKTVRWTPIESIGVTLAIYFGAQLIGALLVYTIPLIRGMDKDQALDWMSNNTYGQFITIAAVEALTVWLVYRFLKLRKATLKTIGLDDRPKWAYLGYIALSFIAYTIVFIFVTSVAKQLAPSLNIEQKQQIGFVDRGNFQLPFIFISLVLLPPIAEEILVRGFLYTGLRKGLPKFWAVIIASGLFGIAHLQAGSGEPLLWIAGIDTFILSLFLINLRERTGSLWASIGLHTLKNLIAFMSIFIFHLG
jgi:membrane protease YdiL (CAAX protease family)